MEWKEMSLHFLYDFLIKPSQAPADRPAQEVGIAGSVLKSGRALCSEFPKIR